MVRIGIVGATGMVGQEMLALLGESKLAPEEIRASASASSAGKILPTPLGPVTVQQLTDTFFTDLNFCFFCAGTEVSRAWIPRALKAGTVVIDNSSAYRADPGVPLIVPEVNGYLLAGRPRLVANPNCCVAQLVPVLAPVAKAFGLLNVTIATYQAVTGAGYRPTRELETDAAQFPRSAPRADRLLFNVLPAIGAVDSWGHCEEEKKIVHETRKILNLPRLPVAVTSARVAVLRGHCLAVSLTTENNCSASGVVQALADAANVEVYGHGPQPVQAAFKNCVAVGRIRANTFWGERSFSLWIAADNLRKGAAHNALAIAEHWCDGL